ncbi:MAG: dTMP kinase [Nocardioidaceae bacterium]
MSRTDASESFVNAPAHSLAAVLRLRAFRRLWIGLGLSSLGDWLGLLALTAFAGELAGKGYAEQNFAIAGVLFLRVIPAVVLGPISGYIADRLDRRWNLIIGDILRFGLFASIPIVTSVLGDDQRGQALAWVFVVTVLVEAISLVWLPTKDATVPNLVPPERLETANQLSLATTYGSALPAAGIFAVLTAWIQGLDSLIGPWTLSPIDVALYFNALSYLVSGLVIATLHEIPKGSSVAEGDRTGLWRTIVEGWSYVSRTKVVRGLVVGIVGAFGAGGVVIGLARVFVSDLGGGDPAYGVLFGSVFLGLALGMWLGPRTLRGLSRRRLFGISLTAAGVLLAALALTPDLVLVSILTVILGFCAGVAWITGYTLLGLEVANEVRGRTFAFVQSMIRLVLALVLAAAPALAGLIGAHSFRVNDDLTLSYNGASITFLLAAVVATVVGVTAYRQMDDRPGVPLHRDVVRALTSTPGLYSHRGVFVAFEGGEGAGKSTQARMLSEWLTEHGYDVLRTREPGATEVGGKLRDILLDPQTGVLSPRTEALLYAADKAEHVDAEIVPALRRGAVVITDRFVDSTLAYQGAGRQLRPDEIERLARWSTSDLRPHLTVLLDLPPEVGLSRFDSTDRLEAEPLAFHERVRGAFLTLAASDALHYAVLDASRPPADIAAEVRARLQPLLSRAGHGAGGDAVSTRPERTEPESMSAESVDAETVEAETVEAESVDAESVDAESVDGAREGASVDPEGAKP